jgi:hypothetical protein
MPKKTLPELLSRAESAISRKEDLVYEVADAHGGQIVGNVGHMRWFKLAVAEELVGRFAVWEHLKDELKPLMK